MLLLLLFGLSESEEKLALRFKLLVGDRYLERWFPTIPWELGMKLEYETIFWGFLLTQLFVWYLYPKEAHKRVMQALFGAFTTLSLLTLVTPAEIYTQTLGLVQLLLVAGALYVLSIYLLAARHQRQGAGLFLVGILTFVIAVIHDSMLYVQGLKSSDWLPYGFLFFVFSQAVALSWRSAKAFEEVEALSYRLLSLDKLKDEFLANTSHELRTPPSDWDDVFRLRSK